VLHVGLVAYRRTKTDRPRPARDLYVSPLFGAARAYTERHYDQWLILSALPGLVDPDTVLRPYDLSLRQLSAGEREVWANHIALELTDRYPAGTRLWFYAGVVYREAIAPVVPHQVRCPWRDSGLASSSPGVAVTPNSIPDLWTFGQESRRRNGVRALTRFRAFARAPTWRHCNNRRSRTATATQILNRGFDSMSTGLNLAWQTNHQT